MTDYRLDVEKDSNRLDKYIAQKLPDLSRTRIKAMLSSQTIRVNDKIEKASYKVKSGDQIKIHVPPKKALNLVAENIPLEIVYEDQDVIVVNKPQGMVVHPSAGHPDHTLVNALLFHTRHLAESPEGFRPGIVHRIDKDTSGLLMIAKNDHARDSLEKQLAAKTNPRFYLAIVHGNFTEKRGTITAPIGRSPYNRKQMAVVPNGRSAVTHFEVLEQFSGYTLIRCQLETGRTHQIRVHLKYIGHPVAGDPLYGPSKTLHGHGQFLHAAVLGFVQPSTGEKKIFHCDPPEIFQQQLKKLREKG